MRNGSLKGGKGFDGLKDQPLIKVKVNKAFFQLFC